jgi:hypothetical protein
MAVYEGGWRSTEVGRGWLRIRRPQVRVLPSAPEKVTGLQQKRSPTTRFIRLLTCPILQLVPQRGAEGTVIEHSPDTMDRERRPTSTEQRPAEGA